MPDQAPLQFDRDALLSAIRMVNEVVQQRNTILILSNMLVEARGDGSARLRGTDLDRQVEVLVPCQGQGAFTAPVDKLAAGVESLRPGSITIAIGDGRAVLRQGKASRTLPTLPVADMPMMKDVEGAIRFELAREQLSWLLDMTHVAMETNETRAFLCGVYLHVKDDKLRAVGLDGIKLVRAEVDMPEMAALMPGVIIPRAAVALLRRVLSRSTGDKAALAVSSERISLMVDGLYIIAKTVDGEYPDYERIIPRPTDQVLHVQAGELRRALAATCAVIEAAKGVRRVAFMLDGEDCELTARTVFTDANEPFAGKMTGDKLVMGTNAMHAAPLAATRPTKGQDA